MVLKSKVFAGWLGGKRRQRMPNLGARELEALECLWAQRSSSAVSLRAQLAGGRIALSTVQSTLERLYRKGLVTREKDGRAYRYAPACSRSQFIGLLLRDIADDVAGGELAPMMSGFAEYIAGEDQEIDPELARLLGREDGRDE